MSFCHKKNIMLHSNVTAYWNSMFYSPHIALQLLQSYDSGTRLLLGCIRKLGKSNCKIFTRHSNRMQGWLLRILKFNNMTTQVGKQCCDIWTNNTRGQVINLSVGMYSVILYGIMSSIDISKDSGYWTVMGKQVYYITQELYKMCKRVLGCIWYSKTKSTVNLAPGSEESLTATSDEHPTNLG